MTEAIGLETPSKFNSKFVCSQMYYFFGEFQVNSFYNIEKKYTEKNTKRQVMGGFADAERRILVFMVEGTEFIFQGKDYKIILFQ